MITDFGLAGIYMLWGFLVRGTMIIGADFGLEGMLWGFLVSGFGLECMLWGLLVSGTRIIRVSGHEVMPPGSRISHY